MNNFTIFVVGIAVTLITGMGVLTSQVFMGYKEPHKHGATIKSKSDQNI
jgi:hypothetical protein